MSRRHPTPIAGMLQPELVGALAVPDFVAPLVASPCDGVYIFDAFTREFCRQLLEATDACEASSPNTMNRYGLVLKDAGFGPLCQQLLDRVVAPLARRFYAHTPKLRRHHGFIVDYEPRKQGSLARHVDDSVVTLNVCLGRKFTGGELVFRDNRGRVVANVDNVVGRAVLHLGSHEHQARRVRSGRRTNLILWCRA